MAPGPHKEIEIKLEVAPANLANLKKVPLLRMVKPEPKGATQVSVYFDTNKQKLRKKGLIIKATGNDGNFERDEWEAKSRAMSRISIRPAGRRLNRF